MSRHRLLNQVDRGNGNGNGTCTGTCIGTCTGTNTGTNTYLVGIKVHFDSHSKICGPHVTGLTMIYNDNVEIPIGQIKAVKHEELKLSRGEHIVAVQGAHAVDDVNMDIGSSNVCWLIGIRFLTTKDRWLTMDPEGEAEDDV